MDQYIMAEPQVMVKQEEMIEQQDLFEHQGMAGSLMFRPDISGEGIVEQDIDGEHTVQLNAQLVPYAPAVERSTPAVALFDENTSTFKQSITVANDTSFTVQPVSHCSSRGAFVGVC